jgi:hypothetical protein
MTVYDPQCVCRVCCLMLWKRNILYPSKTIHSTIADNECHCSVYVWFRTVQKKLCKHMVTIQAKGNTRTVTDMLLNPWTTAISQWISQPGSSLLNTLMFPNLWMKKKRYVWKQGLLPYRLSTLAWKQLGNSFEMLYVVQALVQYHVTPHMFARGSGGC